MSDHVISRSLQALKLGNPRITREDVTDNVEHAEIVEHVSKSGQILRWGVLTTKNGFAVTGRPSCSVSSANDNPEIGKRIAIENATDELWPLMGYALKEKLWLESGVA